MNGNDSRSSLCKALCAATLSMLAAASGAQASCTTGICTGGNPCTISGTHTIDDGCALSFGCSQDVIITGTMQTSALDETFSIAAHSIDVNGGTLRAKGGNGGVDLTTCGTGDPFVKTRAGAVIDTSQGGTTLIDALGTVEISGNDLSADGGNIDCDGGGISIAGTSVNVTKTIHADGAGCDGSGGSIAIEATTGSVTLSGTGSVTVNAGGSGYDGGSIEVSAVTTISQGKTMQAKGVGDGWGGTIDLTSASTGATGLVTVSGATNASGGNGSDSRGGDIAISAGAVTTSGSLTSNAGYFNAGIISVAAEGGDISIGAAIVADGSNGGDGGAVTITGDRTVTVDGQVSANGSGNDCGGGSIAISAGTNHTLSVQKVLEAKATNAGRADADGTITIGPACDLSITNDLRSRNTNIGGGENRLIYLGTATVSSTGALLADDPTPGSCATAANGNVVQCRCPDVNSDNVCDSATCVSAPTLTGTVTPTRLLCPTVMPACS